MIDLLQLSRTFYLCLEAYDFSKVFYCLFTSRFNCSDSELDDDDDGDERGLTASFLILFFFQTTQYAFYWQVNLQLSVYNASAVETRLIFLLSGFSNEKYEALYHCWIRLFLHLQLTYSFGPHAPPASWRQQFYNRRGSVPAKSKITFYFYHHPVSARSQGNLKHRESSSSATSNASHTNRTGNVLHTKS